MPGAPGAGTGREDTPPEPQEGVRPRDTWTLPAPRENNVVLSQWACLVTPRDTSLRDATEGFAPCPQSQAHSASPTVLSHHQPRAAGTGAKGAGSLAKVEGPKGWGGF